MNIELRNLEYNPALSEETPAFTATLVLNGKPRGRIRNSGRGGAIHYEDRSAEKELDAVAATLPPMEIEGMIIPENAETLLFGIVLEQGERKN
jgi:hypothetical protein